MFQFLRKNHKDRKIEFILFGLCLFFGLVVSLLTFYFGNGQFLWSSDAEGFFDLAKNFIQHHGFYADYDWGPQSMRTPAYPFFVAVIYFLTHSLYFVVFVQNLLAAITVVVIYRLGLVIFNKFAAVVATILYIFESQRLQVTNQVMSESLFNLFFLVAIFFLYKFLLSHERYRLLFYSGIFFGLSLLTKPIIQFLIFVFIFYVCWFCYKKTGYKKILIGSAILCGTILIVTGPWLIRNGLIFGKWQLSSAGGVNLYYVNAAHLLEYLEKKENREKSFYAELTDAAIFDLGIKIDRGNFVKESLKLMDFGYEDYFAKKSIKIILEHPAEYVAFHLERCVVFFIESSASRSYGAMLYSLKLPSVLFYPILFWGGRIWWSGLFLLLVFSYIMNSKRINWQVASSLFFIILYFAAITSPNWDVPRMRLPILPIYFLLLGNGISLLIGDRQSMKKHRDLDDIYKQVPPDYWDNIHNNIFQRMWYFLRFRTLKKVMKGLDDGSAILDVGCGSGFSIEKSIPKGKTLEVFGVDVSADNIEYAKKRRPQYNFQVAQGEKLPYADSRFDAVLYLDVIEHLTDPELSLREAYRVLKISGLLIVLVVKERHWLFQIIWWIWLRLRGKVWHEAHLRTYDELSLQKVINGAGFTSLEMRKIHFGMSLLALAKK